MRISDWSSDVCSSDLCGNGVTLDATATVVAGLRVAGLLVETVVVPPVVQPVVHVEQVDDRGIPGVDAGWIVISMDRVVEAARIGQCGVQIDRKSTRLNSSH